MAQAGRNPIMVGMDQDRLTPTPAPLRVQQRNIAAIAKVEATVLGERSIGERASRWLIRKIGTPGAVILHLTLIAAWIAWNAGPSRGPAPFDPCPFPLLALVASAEAIMLGLLILTSQNRLQHEADRRAHLSLQIGMMAEMEGTKMLQMLDRLCRHAGLEGVDQALLAELTADTDPETIATTLKDSIPVDD